MTILYVRILLYVHSGHRLDGNDDRHHRLDYVKFSTHSQPSGRASKNLWGHRDNALQGICGRSVVGVNLFSEMYRKPNPLLVSQKLFVDIVAATNIFAAIALLLPIKMHPIKGI